MHNNRNKVEKYYMDIEQQKSCWYLAMYCRYLTHLKVFQWQKFVIQDKVSHKKFHIVLISLLPNLYWEYWIKITCKGKYFISGILCTFACLVITLIVSCHNLKNIKLHL